MPPLHCFATGSSRRLRPDGCVQVSPSSSSHLGVFLLSYQEISVYLLSSRRPLCQAAASSRG